MTPSLEIPAEQWSWLGRPPQSVYRPQTEAEAAECVREAVERRLALLPWGGGTSIRQGNLLRAGGWAILSTERLTGETEFSPADMVVTAAAGTSLSALQRQVRTANPFLPIDAPVPDRATMGGIVAANAQGLWRGGFGLPRDRLLGVRVVLANGTVIKGGGKVVKNVAGYDLNKLFAGSWGTLGLITETTFKTNPMPESTLHLNFRGAEGEQAAIAALAIYTARLEPAYLLVAVNESGVLSVGLMGSAETVKWQADQVSALAAREGLKPGASEPAADQLRIMVEEGDLLRARFGVRPTDIPELIRLLRSSAGTVIRAQLSAGVLDAQLEGLRPGPAAVAAVESAVPNGGHLTWTNVPDEWRPYIRDVWGKPGGGFQLMRGIKQALDPPNLFSPGRFLGGL